MRFDIGPGGMFLILVGLAGLSAAVFGLGLVAGHELAGPDSAAQPAVASYPLPANPPPAQEASAPAASAAPAAAASIAAPAPVAVNHLPPPPPAASAAVPAVETGASAAPPAAVNAATPHRATAAAAPRTRTASREENLGAGAAVAPPPDTGEPEEAEAEPPPRPAVPARRVTTSTAPPRPVGGPYSVQIDAMMDLNGARQMAQKIRAKGFEPYIVPTNVGGKVWYRLRVGHYATPEQAQAAESRLHQEFNDNSAAH